MCRPSDVTTKCHTIWAALVLKDFIRIGVIVFRAAEHGFIGCICFLFTQAAFIFSAYFGNCLVCLGGCAWCACGCDWEYLFMLGERRILSLRKATKLHLWSDRGLKWHKQLLHRQPAVACCTAAAEAHIQRISLVSLYKNLNPTTQGSLINQEL